MILTHWTVNTNDEGIETALCGRRRDEPGDGVFHRYTEDKVRATCPNCCMLIGDMKTASQPVMYGGVISNDPRPTTDDVAPDFAVDENYNAEDE